MSEHPRNLLDEANAEIFRLTRELDEARQQFIAACDQNRVTEGCLLEAMSWLKRALKAPAVGPLPAAPNEVGKP